MKWESKSIFEHVKKSLIYEVREHRINQNLGSAESVRLGISEVQMETQQGNVYMNGNTGRQIWRGTINET